MNRIASLLARGAERPGEVLEEIVRMLEPDGKPDRPGRDAGGGERRVVHAEMGRRRGMDHERLRIADVREVREERERLDEAPARLAPARELEGEDRARAA